MIQIWIFLMVSVWMFAISYVNPQEAPATKPDTLEKAPTVPNNQVEQITPDEEESGPTIFAGHMRDGHFQMKLTEKEGKLIGNYYLTDLESEVVTEFNLTGSIDGEGNFVLTETNTQGVKTDEISGSWSRYNDDDGYISYLIFGSPTKMDLYGGPILAQEQKIFFTGGAKFEKKYFARNFGRSLYISGHYPRLSGIAGAEKFNSAVKSIIDREINSFRRDLKNERDHPPSSLLIEYNVEYADENIISIGFTGNTMTEGAAHKNVYHFTLNSDLKTGRIMKLADLFKPASPFLQRISAYCIAKLNDRGLASPDPDNVVKAESYRTWSLTSQGLLIKFDPYEVDSYAGGTKKIMVPFKELKAMIRKNGPAKFLIDY